MFISVFIGVQSAKAPAAFHITHENFLTLEPAKPRPQHAGRRDWAAVTGHIYSRKVLFERRVVLSSVKGMANDKDTLDSYTAGSLEPAGESDKKGKNKTYFWPVFSPSPWISSCRLVDSSRRPPWAQKQQQHYLHLTSIVSCDTFAHAHRPFNLTPSPGPKNFPMYSSSSLFCPIVSPLDHLSLPLLLFLLLLLSLHHLTFPPSLLLPSPYPRPPSHPYTLHPPHSAPASTLLDFYPFNSDCSVFSNTAASTVRYGGEVKVVIMELHF